MQNAACPDKVIFCAIYSQYVKIQLIYCEPYHIIKSGLPAIFQLERRQPFEKRQTDRCSMGHFRAYGQPHVQDRTNFGSSKNKWNLEDSGRCVETG